MYNAKNKHLNGKLYFTRNLAIYVHKKQKQLNLHIFQKYIKQKLLYIQEFQNFNFRNEKKILKELCTQ